MGNNNTLQPTGTVLWQAQYDLARSELLLTNEEGERFTYYTHHIQVRRVYPHENWNSFYWGVGTHFAHADHGALGSFRALANLEGGARLFIPLPMLRMFTLEAGVAAGLGWSELNFGGGDIPQGGFDARLGGMARLSFEREGYRIGLEVFEGVSPARGYWEQDLGIAFSAPLGSVAEVVPDPCVDKLLALEKEVADVQKEAQEKKTLIDEIRLLTQQLEEQFFATKQFHQTQTKRKEELEKDGFVCPEVPEQVKNLNKLTRYPELPKRSVFNSCPDSLNELQKYLKALHLFIADASRYRPYYSIHQEGLKKLLELYGRLEKWPLECQNPDIPGGGNITVVRVEKTTYRLLTDFLFPNSNPNVKLSSQMKLVNGKSKSARATEPYLDEWIRFLRDHNKIYKIRIDGYASDNYSPDANFDEPRRIVLATKRAENVRDYLLTRGRNIQPGTRCERISKKSVVYYYDENNKRVRIDNIPFVPCKAEGPIDANQIIAVKGHGDEGLEQLAKERFGEQFDRKLLSDPAFRMVRITLFKRQPDGTWQPVRLEGSSKP